MGDDHVLDVDIAALELAGRRVGQVCDSCPSVDIIVLVDGLFRAVVAREAGEIRAGVGVALWRAARSWARG